MPEGGASNYPYQRDWDWEWLWQDILFCPDPLTAQPLPKYDEHGPLDISERCQYPFRSARPVTPAKMVPTWNAFGPAMYFPNDLGPGFYPAREVYDDHGTNKTGDGGTEQRKNWTVAFGWSNVQQGSGLIGLWEIDTVNPARTFKLQLNLTNGDFTFTHPGGTLTKSSRVSGFKTGETGSCVITVSGTRPRIRMYCNGWYVGGVNKGYALNDIDYILLGVNSGVGIFQNNCILGTLGPFILSHGVWGAGQVQQWAAEPWAFLDSWIPRMPAAIGGVAGDLITKQAVAGELSIAPAVLGDLSIKQAVAGELLFGEEP